MEIKESYNNNIVDLGIVGEWFAASAKYEAMKNNGGVLITLKSATKQNEEFMRSPEGIEYQNRLRQEENKSTGFFSKINNYLKIL